MGMFAPRTTTRQFVLKLLLALCPALIVVALWLAPRLANTARQGGWGMTIATRQSGQSSLIVYDGAANSGDGLITARFVANLLGHFGIKSDMRSMADYKPGLIEQ